MRVDNKPRRNIPGLFSTLPTSTSIFGLLVVFGLQSIYKNDVNTLQSEQSYVNNLT
jgi:hypothetical protein